MAQFFKEKSNKSKQLSSKLSVTVTQLDHLGAGMAQLKGKVVFVPGVLPNEQATVQLVEQKKNFSKAKLVSIDVASDLRVVPACPYYVQCGGCDIQHMTVDAQREHKQAVLIDLMQKQIGPENVTADVVLPSLHDDGWHYRRRARLATVFDKNSQTLQLGFRANSSNSIVQIKHCAVLAKSLSDLIQPFSINLNQLKAKASLGHLELTEADNGIFAVLRVTKVLPASDIRWLTDFANIHKIHLLLQNNDNTLIQLAPIMTNESDDAELPFYGLANNAVACHFSPGNFVQVNARINTQMVDQAIDWLDPQAGERILDLFCGVGNFSLPLAKRGAEVVGVEGIIEMVQQARVNAQQNNLQNLQFFHADLSADLSYEPWLGRIDKLLLDPARAGAYESLQWLKKMQPKKVVYVSCNPASLARDSAVLVEHGYKLTKMSFVDMFPQTHHIEAMVLFELS